MTIAYRPPSTKVLPPPPPEFAEQFIAGGWRRIERIYGSRSDRLLKWFEMSGGDDLRRRRAEHMHVNKIGGACRVAAVTREAMEV